MEENNCIENTGLAIVPDCIYDLFCNTVLGIAAVCYRNPKWFHLYRNHSKPRIRNKYKNKIIKEYTKSIRKC